MQIVVDHNKWPKVMIRKRASLKIRYDTVMITASGRELDPFPITGRAPTPAVTESSSPPEFSVTKGLERHYSRLGSLDAPDDCEDRCITMHCRDGCG